MPWNLRYKTSTRGPAGRKSVISLILTRPKRSPRAWVTGLPTNCCIKLTSTPRSQRMNSPQPRSRLSIVPLGRYCLQRLKGRQATPLFLPPTSFTPAPGTLHLMKNAKQHLLCPRDQSTIEMIKGWSNGLLLSGLSKKVIENEVHFWEDYV